MKHEGISVYDEENKIVISDVRDFEPAHIFDCGQAFRWKRQQDDTYTGVVHGKVINVGRTGNDIIIKNTNFEEFKELWYDYFDFGNDYEEIKETLKLDENMNNAIGFGHGIRILKQDFNEMLMSFIISSNNRIPMIMRTIEKLSEKFGSKIFYDNKEYFEFPEMESIANAKIEDLSDTKMGFRAKYIFDASKKVLIEGISQNKLIKMDTQSVINELIKLPGVGNKVASCVTLFSGIKHDVFPTDVWVKRVMEELYFSSNETSIPKILDFSKEYFGKYAGFAQQYLFYYAREKRIGCKSK